MIGLLALIGMLTLITGVVLAFIFLSLAWALVIVLSLIIVLLLIVIFGITGAMADVFKGIWR